MKKPAAEKFLAQAPCKATPAPATPCLPPAGTVTTHKPSQGPARMRNLQRHTRWDPAVGDLLVLLLGCPGGSERDAPNGAHSNHRCSTQCGCDCKEEGCAVANPVRASQHWPWRVLPLSHFGRTGPSAIGLMIAIADAAAGSGTISRSILLEKLTHNRCPLPRRHNASPSLHAAASST